MALPDELEREPQRNQYKNHIRTLVLQRPQLRVRVHRSMEPDFAKRDLNLTTERIQGPAIVMKSNRRGSQRNAANAESKLSGEIETIILKRSSTETIPLQKLVGEMSEEFACQSDKII